MPSNLVSSVSGQLRLIGTRYNVYLLVIINFLCACIAWLGKIVRGMKEHSLISEVLQEWQGIVNREAKSEIGEKVIVCRRSARSWDSEIKERIMLRWQLYKKAIS